MAYERITIQRKNGKIDLDTPLHKAPDAAMPRKPRPVQKPRKIAKTTSRLKRAMAILTLGTAFGITPAIPTIAEMYDPAPASYNAPVERAELFPDATDGTYLLIGSSSPRNANIHLKTLTELGFPVATEIKEKDGKMHKRVMISYDDPEELGSLVQKLEQYGHTERPYLITKSEGKDGNWRQYVKPVACDTLSIRCIEKASSISSLPFYDEVSKAAKELAADPELRAKGLDEHMAKKIIYTQIIIESNGKAGAVSHAGAVGLLQVLPTTAMDANGYAIPKDKHAYHRLIAGIHQRLLDPAYNIGTMKNVSRSYLGIALDHTGAETIEDALDAYLAAYNAGPTNMKNGKYRKFKETRDYIKKGKNVYRTFTARFG